MDDNLTKEYETYDPSFFNKLKKVEEEYFWFLIRRKWIFNKISKFAKPPAKVLEIGCGTGNVSSFLSQKGYTVTGCELYHEAIDMAWPGFLRVRGDANSLPFKDNSFDIVGLFDVIEHVENDITPIKEAFRVVREGGIIAVTVPANKKLWSYIDERSLHKRRYSREMLRQVFSEARLPPLLLEYMFMSLYWPIKYSRGKNKDINSQFKINRFINALLKWVFNMERLASRVLSIPIGTSIISVARKDTLS